MRDLFIACYLLGPAPLILLRPYVGVLLWCVVSYMNPHQMGWGTLATFPFAAIIGGVTLLAVLIPRGEARLRLDPILVLMAVWTLFVSLTTLTAIHPEVAVVKWDRVIKVLLMTFVTYFVMQTRERIHALVWVLVLSIGIYGVRGGLFTLVTGGGGRVFGPPNTMIEDNNQLAVGLIMILPLMRYLQVYSADKWVRLGMAGAMFACGISIVGSFSRGALLASSAMVVWMILRTRRKVLTLAAMAVVIGCGLAVAPQHWFDRMNTIKSYEEDDSAQGRFDAWAFAYEVAVRRPLVGGGFSINTDSEMFMRLVPDAATARAFHSNYFEVLGEHGFVGLGLFLLLGLAALIQTEYLRRRHTHDPETGWAGDLAAMVQTSLVGYAVGGLFLNLAFFDLFYHLLVIISLIGLVTQRQPAAGRGPAYQGAPVGNSTR